MINDDAIRLGAAMGKVAQEAFAAGDAPQDISHPDDVALLTWLAAERLHEESTEG